jgi:CspA family cold shock protein
MSERITGKVKWFDAKKGFGFILSPEGKDVFVHFSTIEGAGFRTLKDGEPVEYEILAGDKGLHARSVRRLESPVMMEVGQPRRQVEVEQAVNA